VNFIKQLEGQKATREANDVSMERQLSELESEHSLLKAAYRNLLRILSQIQIDENSNTEVVAQLKELTKSLPINLEQSAVAVQSTQLVHGDSDDSDVSRGCICMTEKECLREINRLQYKARKEKVIRAEKEERKKELKSENEKLSKSIEVLCEHISVLIRHSNTQSMPSKKTKS